MRPRTLRKALLSFVVLLVPVMWLATKYQPYLVDGDSVAYMDIADLLRTHRWAGAVNGYWNPLYPCLLTLGQLLWHPARMHELAAYRTINYGIFFAEICAVLLFVSALAKLRGYLESSMVGDASPNPHFLLDRYGLQLLGVGLVTVAAGRELAVAAIKPDALLQALMMLAFACLLECVATGNLLFAAPMGLFFGLAYLTKSFAFLITFLSIAVLVLCLRFFRRMAIPRVVAAGLFALGVFACVAGPYVAALSHQKHRFDFGDSGALNYAWYAGDTEKMHVEPWMTSAEFGSATVHLVHPEVQLLATPGIYSYRAEPYGTYPDWFDPSFFHERTIPHLNPHALLRRDLRNLVLVVRYLLNHPEGLILLALLVALGAKLRWNGWRGNLFWLPMVALGLAMWVLYGIVNIEERYVTLAFLVVLLPVFAMLQTAEDEASGDKQNTARWPRRAAAGAVTLLAFLALGEALRTALEARRSLPPTQPAWYSPEIFGTAEGLAALGVRPGDTVACMGTLACLNDNYWMRLAGVRVLTEIYNPDPANLQAQWQGLPNKPQVEGILRGQGARLLVAAFPAGGTFAEDAGPPGWRRLGHTDLYALPLDGSDLGQPASATHPAQPWPGHIKVAP